MFVFSQKEQVKKKDAHTWSCLSNNLETFKYRFLGRGMVAFILEGKVCGEIEFE